MLRNLKGGFQRNVSPENFILINNNFACYNKNIFFYTTFDLNIMKIQFFTLGILINIIFYSCSAVSSVKHVVCRNDNDITGKYKLSPWKTVEFKVHFKNDRSSVDGNVHVSHSRNVSCTYGFATFKYISKSCTNWHFIRGQTLKYRMRCKGEKLI